MTAILVAVPRLMGGLLGVALIFGFSPSSRGEIATVTSAAILLSILAGWSLHVPGTVGVADEDDGPLATSVKGTFKIAGLLFVSGAIASRYLGAAAGLAILGAAASVVGTYFARISHAQGRSLVFVVGQVAQPAVLLLLLLAGVLTNPDHFVVAWVLLQYCAATFLLFQIGPASLESIRRSREGASSTWRFASSAHIANCGLALSQRSDLLAVSFVAGPESAGVYAVGLLGAEVVVLLGEADALDLLRESSKRPLEKSGHLTRRTVAAAIAVSALGASAILLLRPSYSNAIVPLFLLSGGSVLAANSRAHLARLARNGQRRALSYFGLMGPLSSAFYLVGAQWGPIGAAIASVVVYGLQLLFLRQQLAKFELGIQ